MLSNLSMIFKFCQDFAQEYGAIQNTKFHQVFRHGFLLQDANQI